MGLDSSGTPAFFAAVTSGGRPTGRYCVAGLFANGTPMTILAQAPSYSSLAICAWGFAHQPLERLAEGRLRVITYAPSNFINLGVGRA